MAEEILGWIGLAILLLSWLSEAVQAYKEKTAKIPITFASLYLVAAVLLSLHALAINDTIFLVLNVATGLIALMNIYFYFRGKKPKNKKR